MTDGEWPWNYKSNTMQVLFTKYLCIESRPVGRGVLSANPFQDESISGKTTPAFSHPQTPKRIVVHYPTFSYLTANKVFIQIFLFSITLSIF